jgi:hypothetical protein
MKKITSVSKKLVALSMIIAPTFFMGCGPVDMNDEAAMYDVAGAEADAPADPNAVADPNAPDEKMAQPQMQPQQGQRPDMQRMMAPNAQVSGVVAPAEAIKLPDVVTAEPGTFTETPTVFTEDRVERVIDRDVHVIQNNRNHAHFHNNTHVNTHYNTNIIKHPRLINTTSASRSASFSSSSSVTETVAPLEVVEGGFAPSIGYGVGFGFAGWGNGLGLCSIYYGNCFLKLARYPWLY